VQLTLLYRTVQKVFDVLNRLGVNHECDRQTDGQIAVSNAALSHS